MFEELRKPGGKLKMAVPRGALLGEVLDLLDRIGIETAVVHVTASASPPSPFRAIGSA